jgi:hypothetical protein
MAALCHTAKQAVDRCKDLLSQFLLQIKKYQNSLGENTAHKMKLRIVKAAVMAVRWQVGEREVVDKFRVEIAGTSSSLQMLLATASMLVFCSCYGSSPLRHTTGE